MRHYDIAPKLQKAVSALFLSKDLTCFKHSLNMALKKSVSLFGKVKSVPVKSGQTVYRKNMNFSNERG